jgi:hypothetical protein
MAPGLNVREVSPDIYLVQVVVVDAADQSEKERE